MFSGSVPSTPGVRIERSDQPLRATLRNANPGNWLPVEWDELLDGRLGPWTMVLDGDRAVSICHTPGPLTPRAGECGVWTQPGCRGRGYAAATAAAWAEILHPTGRFLFYSTDAENRSSQRSPSAWACARSAGPGGCAPRSPTSSRCIRRARCAAADRAARTAPRTTAALAEQAEQSRNTGTCSEHWKRREMVICGTGKAQFATGQAGRTQGDRGASRNVA